MSEAPREFRPSSLEREEKVPRDERGQRELMSGAASRSESAGEFLGQVGGYGPLPAPGMTDLMISPEAIDKFLEEHPPPEAESV